MKREEKNALSRQRILDAAMKEFSEKGYDAASLNTICAEKNISKGIIYHYFKDKDELYLLCVSLCYEELTAYLELNGKDGKTVESRLRTYFDARLHFFAERPSYLGIFLSSTLNPPARLSAELLSARAPFDALNIKTLTELLESAPLRSDVSIPLIVEDFRMYMDFFNARFKAALSEGEAPERALSEHEESCHRQLGILLHGVLEK